MRGKLSNSLITTMAYCVLTLQALEVGAAEPLVFISAFTAGDDGAIHAFRLASKTGRLQALQRTTDVENPFFMAVSPDQRFLYSIHAKSFGGKSVRTTKLTDP